MGVRRNRAAGDAPDRRNTGSRLLLFIQEAPGSSKPQAETEQEKEVAEGDPAAGERLQTFPTHGVFIRHPPYEVSRNLLDRLELTNLVWLRPSGMVALVSIVVHGGKKCSGHRKPEA